MTDRAIEFFGRELGGKIEYIPPNEETLHQWRTEIQTIAQYIEDEDITELSILSSPINVYLRKIGWHSRESHDKNSLWRPGELSGASIMDKLLEKRNGQKLDKEEINLLAISLWMMQHMDYNGPVDFYMTGAKLLLGGQRKMADLLTGKKIGNCLDAAQFVDLMAKQFGISGQIKKIRSHRYFQVAGGSGNVVDIWWGLARGGLFSEQEYKHLLKSKRLGDDHEDL